MSDSFWKVVVVAIAGSFEIVLVWGRFSAWSTMAGLILVSILLTVPVRATVNWSERLTASLAWAVSLILVGGRFLEAPLQALSERYPNVGVFGLWLVLAGLSYLLIRSRASSGENE